MSFLPPGAAAGAAGAGAGLAAAQAPTVMVEGGGGAATGMEDKGAVPARADTAGEAPMVT